MLSHSTGSQPRIQPSALQPLLLCRHHYLPSYPRLNPPKTLGLLSLLLTLQSLVIRVQLRMLPMLWMSSLKKTVCLCLRLPYHQIPCTYPMSFFSSLTKNRWSSSHTKSHAGNNPAPYSIAYNPKPYTKSLSRPYSQPFWTGVQHYSANAITNIKPNTRSDP